MRQMQLLVKLVDLKVAVSLHQIKEVHRLRIWNPKVNKLILVLTKIKIDHSLSKNIYRCKRLKFSKKVAPINFINNKHTNHIGGSRKILNQISNRRLLWRLWVCRLLVSRNDLQDLIKKMIWVKTHTKVIIGKDNYAKMNTGFFSISGVKCHS